MKKHILCHYNTSHHTTYWLISYVIYNNITKLYVNNNNEKKTMLMQENNNFESIRLFENPQSLKEFRHNSKISQLRKRIQQNCCFLLPFLFSTLKQQKPQVKTGMWYFIMASLVLYLNLWRVQPETFKSFIKSQKLCHRILFN